MEIGWRFVCYAPFGINLVLREKLMWCWWRMDGDLWATNGFRDRFFLNLYGSTHLSSFSVTSASHQQTHSIFHPFQPLYYPSSNTTKLLFKNIIIFSLLSSLFSFSLPSLSLLSPRHLHAAPPIFPAVPHLAGWCSPWCHDSTSPMPHACRSHSPCSK